MRPICLLLASPRLGRSFPRGVMHIASFLEQQGYPVTVLPLAFYVDANFTQAAELTPAQESNLEACLADAIRRIQPQVVGIGNPFSIDYFDCLKMLGMCKRLDERIVTVIGGPHVTFQDAESVQFPQVDVVVRGEGEWTMRDLLAALEQGRDLTTVAGISFRRAGQVIRTPDRALGNLDELPPFNFELLPEDYMRQTHIQGVSTRGCAYRCRYCVESAFWQRRRLYPISHLVDEIELLAQRYNNQMTGFFDSMIDTRSGSLFDFCDEIVRRKIALHQDFHIHVRANHITAASVQAMQRAGIRRVEMGVESVSPRVLAMMNRTVTAAQIESACRLLRAGGIHVHTYWIIGHPGDTPQESDYSFRFLKYLYEHDLTQSAEAMIFQPYPGTCFYDEPDKYGMEILHRDWSKWNRFKTQPASQLTDFSAERIYAAWERFDRLITVSRRLQRLDLQAFDRAPVQPGAPQFWTNNQQLTTNNQHKENL
jgi:radical SAM superfamily enzyme YgiQ (UPF0313 family)